MQLFIGLTFGALIGFFARRAGALDRSGAWAATLSGGLIFGLGGFPWATVLLAFFISSSALSRSFARQKAGLSEKFSKGSRRDWGQVLANGGLGALLVIAHTLDPAAAWPWIAFAGAMASVNADTWATEIGVLNPAPPRLITTGKVVERGASGGISLLGSLAALGGAATIGLLAALVSAGGMGQMPGALTLFGLTTIAGFCGSFFDSLLGATVQAIYKCPICEKETERHPHHLCGAPTIHLRGWRWLNNDMVNFSASLLGAMISIGLWSILN